MFPKFQKASDKLRMLLQNRANFSAFRSYTSMARKSSKVQALYELCQNMFTPSGSPPPSSAAINKLCSVLVRLAKLAVDKVLTAPCGTSVLYPRKGGNLHYFTAVTPCAVLDILTPPYREDAGRKCTYYRDYPYTAFATGNGIKIEDGKEEEYAWLAETEPDNLYMRPGNYTGPTIQV